MRLFTTFDEAASEIRRDLAKSPQVKANQVQGHQTQPVSIHEALNYSFTVKMLGIPLDAREFVQDAAIHFRWMKDPEVMEQLIAWMEMQKWERIRFTARDWKDPSDLNHPLLGKVAKESGLSYIYGERMIGMIDAMGNALFGDITSRRAFWPIFQPGDAIRAGSPIRIPCTIGYHATIRTTPGTGPQLHWTTLMRSCDFESFWATDLWMGRALAQQLLDSYLKLDSTLGMLSMQILSFHSYETEEIY